jgi:hypothetical protein
MKGCTCISLSKKKVQHFNLHNSYFILALHNTSTFIIHTSSLLLAGFNRVSFSRRSPHPRSMAPPCFPFARDGVRIALGARGAAPQRGFFKKEITMRMPDNDAKADVLLESFGE